MLSAAPYTIYYTPTKLMAKLVLLITFSFDWKTVARRLPVSIHRLKPIYLSFGVAKHNLPGTAFYKQHGMGYTNKWNLILLSFFSFSFIRPPARSDSSLFFVFNFVQK